MAQTSVEIIEDFMKANQYFIGNDLLVAFEQAKEMHNIELGNAYEEGWNDAMKEAIKEIYKHQ